MDAKVAHRDCHEEADILILDYLADKVLTCIFREEDNKNDRGHVCKTNDSVAMLDGQSARPRRYISLMLIRLP